MVGKKNEVLDTVRLILSIIFFLITILSIKLSIGYFVEGLYALYSLFTKPYWSTFGFYFSFASIIIPLILISFFVLLTHLSFPYESKFLNNILSRVVDSE